MCFDENLNERNSCDYIHRAKRNRCEKLIGNGRFSRDYVSASSWRSERVRFDATEFDKRSTKNSFITKTNRVTFRVLNTYTKK